MLQAVLQSFQLLGSYKLTFADENLISKAYLPSCLLTVIQSLCGMLGVHQGQYRVKQKAFSNFIVHEKSLGYWSRIG